MWNLASAVGSGSPFFGLPTEKTNVLFIELDSTDRGTAERLKKWRGPEPEGVYFLFLPSMSIPNVPNEQKLLIMNAIKDVNPGLIIISSLQKCHDLDSKEQRTVKLVYSFWDQICGPNRAYIFVHHERKKPADPKFWDGDREKFSGSKGWFDSAQVAIQLKKHSDGKRANLQLVHHKSQESNLYKPLPLLLAPDGTHLTSYLFDELVTVSQFLQENSELLAVEKDKKLAKILSCSENTAKRRRLLIDSGKFPGTEWLGIQEEQEVEESE